MKKLQLFDQNHGLSPLQKYQFCRLFKYMFILSKSACFLTRTSPNTFSACILHKTKRKQNYNFWPTLWTNPFGKMPILWVFKPTFSLFRKACLLCKTSKIVFSRSIFRFSNMGIQGLQGVTRGYKGWQLMRRGYRGLQGVTGGYKWLQGVTGGYKGLQRVTKNYRNFCLTRGYNWWERMTRGYRAWEGVTGGYKSLPWVPKDYKGLQGVTRGFRGLQRIIETFF